VRVWYCLLSGLVACGSSATPPTTPDSFLTIWAAESYGSTASAAPTFLDGYYGTQAWDPLGPVVRMDECVAVGTSVPRVSRPVQGVVDVEIEGAGVWSFADISIGFGPVDAPPRGRILGEGTSLTLLEMRDGPFALDELVADAPGPPQVSAPSESSAISRHEPVEVRWTPRGELSVLISLAFFGPTGEFLLAEDCLAGDTGQLVMNPWPNVPASATSVALRARYEHAAVSQTPDVEYSIRVRSILVRSLEITAPAT
jgi:hypothetical protein